MKLTLSKEILQAIEALPKDVRVEVYSLVFNYVFNGFIPESLSPTAEAVFLLIKPCLDKQRSGKSQADVVKNDDKTDENIEKMFDAENKNASPQRIVAAAANYGICVSDVRAFLNFVRQKGVLHKYRNEDFAYWQSHTIDAITVFARDKLKPQPA